MAAKPEIQYVGQFYVYGSEAKKLEPKHRERRKAAPQLQPQEQAEQARVISVDPVALIGLVVAVVMLVSLVFSAVQIGDTWVEYEHISQYMSRLKQINAELEHTFITNYNIEEVEAAALALGMIPATEAKTLLIPVSIPQPEPEPGLWEELCWFMEGLFA